MQRHQGPRVLLSRCGTFLVCCSHPRVPDSEAFRVRASQWREGEAGRENVHFLLRSHPEGMHIIYASISHYHTLVAKEVGGNVVMVL